MTSAVLMTHTTVSSRASAKLSYMCWPSSTISPKIVPGVMIAVVGTRPSVETRKIRTRPRLRMNKVSTGLCGEYSKSPAVNVFIGAAAPMASISAGLRSRKMSTSDMHQVFTSSAPRWSTDSASSRRPGAHGGGWPP